MHRGPTHAPGHPPPLANRPPPQTARKTAVSQFRAKKVQFLVVTDVAARGIDVPLLENVINYDFPPTVRGTSCSLPAPPGPAARHSPPFDENA